MFIHTTTVPIKSKFKMDSDSSPRAAVLNLRQFRSPTLPVSFGNDTRSRWSRLSGAYAKESKTSPTGKWKKPAVDSPTLERDFMQINHSHVSSRQGYLELCVISQTSKTVPRYLVCTQRGSSASRKTDYQSRGQGFEMWAISFNPRCSSPTEYLVNVVDKIL